MAARLERPKTKAPGQRAERRPALATASLALAILAFWSGPRTSADSVETVKGETISGIVRGILDGKVNFEVARSPAIQEDRLLAAILKDVPKINGTPAAQPNRVVSIPLTDVVRIKFDPIFDRAHRTPPLIDNDQAASGRSLSGTIKLRAGYHRIVLPYWHGGGRPLLRLAYSRSEGKPSERRQRFVRGDLLAHLETGGTETPSPGLDKAGYRIPETLSGEVAPNVTYTVRRQSAGRHFASMGDMLTATTVVSNGTLARISTEPFSEENENLAMLITGYLHVKQDGVYEFVLTSDGGSQLYVGQTPSGLRLMDTSAPAAPWTLTLVQEGTLKGTLEQWTDSKIGVGVATGRSRTSLSLPADRVTEIWSSKSAGKDKPASDDKIDRSNLPANQDMVFARSAAGRLQRVPGRVEGIQGESLVLRFSGESRKIALSKVAGVIMAADRAAKEEDRTFHQIVETYGGIKVACRLTSLDAGVAELHTLWGQPLTFNTDDLSGISIKNGKVVSLTELVPSRVEQVPFFDRMIPFRVNESLSGEAILLRDGKHSRGISVHSKTILRYTIGGRFQRFRTKVGFQLPEGELGDAAVRVMGDDKTLFERPSLRGDGPVEPLDLDVTGVGTLTLAVDFGRGQDVGDRVVWADPTLIRAEVGPIADAAEPHSAK